MGIAVVDDDGAPGRVGGAESGYLPRDLAVAGDLSRGRHDADRGGVVEKPQKSAISDKPTSVDLGPFGTLTGFNPEVARLLFDTRPHDLATEVLTLRRTLMAIGEDAVDGLANGAGYARDALHLIKRRCDGVKKDIWDVAGSGWGTRGLPVHDGEIIAAMGKSQTIWISLTFGQICPIHSP